MSFCQKASNYVQYKSPDFVQMFLKKLTNTIWILKVRTSNRNIDELEHKF